MKRESNGFKMNKDIESAQSVDLVDNKQQLLLSEGSQINNNNKNKNNNKSNKSFLGQRKGGAGSALTTNGSGQDDVFEDEDEQQRFNTTTTTTNNNKNAKQNQTNNPIKTTMTSLLCFNTGGRWLLLLSMTIVLIITAILVAMLTISLLDNEDQCFNSYPFQQPSYKLFSTKTSYSTTYNLLNNSLPGGGSSSSSSSSLNGIGGSGGGSIGSSSGGSLRQHDYDYNSVELPQIFSKSDSLRTIHQRLVSKDYGYGCKVRQLHYFGRHAARYPSSEDVEFINKKIISVQNRIDLSKFSLNNNNNQNTSNKSIPIPTSTSNNTTSPTNVCFNPLAQFKQWVSFMSPEQGNLLMESGVDETIDIAQRFKSIYPELFDADLAKIELGTTNELRTAQTALAFLKQINNFKLGICNDNPESFEPTTQLPPPTQPNLATPAAIGPDGSQVSGSGGQDDLMMIVKSQRALELKANQCYKQFLNKFHLDKLEFHKKCQSYGRDQISTPYNFNLNDANRTRFITSSVSKKLKLSKEDPLTSDETQAIYKICKYESAWMGSSIWCNLFSDSDLKFYEYLSDVDDFFNQAYGHPDQMRSACPVTTDLMRAFKRASQQPSQQPQLPEAHFYFSHSEVIQKILAASVDLENDPEFSLTSIRDHLQAGTTPETRQWRTSLYTPFSANLAFTLYECPKSSSSSSSSSGSKPYENTGGYQIFDVSESPYKVVASLNEQPIQLDGCSGHICDLNELVKDSRIDREKRCRLEDICKVNRVYT